MHSLFSFSPADLLEYLFIIPCVLIALTFHEFSHGWMAYKLGDPTARNLGRLTLNPVKHLDLIGTICMILFHFGWAKPVPVNSRYFKKPRRDMALVAAAGPVMNFILSFIGAFLYCVLIAIFSRVGPTEEGFALSICMSAVKLAYYFHVLNLSLGLFNLIPVPPLDGSRILYIFLPPKIYFGIMKYERYIQIALMLLLWTGILTYPLSIASSWLSAQMLSLWSAILF